MKDGRVNGNRSLRAGGLALSLLALLVACGGATEAPRVELSVIVDDSGVGPVETDLGYEVELTEARLVAEDVSFTVAGEVHAASFWQRLSDSLIPPAHAHPGHFQGGDVTGELRGRFVLDWLGAPGAELGRATLLAGAYRSADFTFAFAGTEDGLSQGDALLSHTAILRGTATRQGSSIEFSVALDAPAGRELTGVPFEFEVREDSRERLGLRLLIRDPVEGDTLFDGLDFAALDGDGDGEVALAPSSTDAELAGAYDRLRRTFMTHDHYDVTASLEE